MAKKKNKQRQQLRLQQQKKLDTALQTARVTETGRIIADHPSHKITPSKMQSIFESAESGELKEQHELFADIEERDSDIAANIATRKRAVLTFDWHIAEPRNATPQEEALQQEIDELFYQMTNFEDLVMDLMDAVGHGFVALEIDWQFVNGKWLPKRFIHRPQSWFKLDKDDNLLLKTQENYEGEPLQPYKWVVHTHKSRSTQLARVGLYRTLAWLYMFKHYSVHDFAEFLELYGMPIRIGKYGAGATEAEKRTLLRALAQIGHNAAGIMPESMTVELHNVANGVSQGNNPFLQMVDWCEKSIARLILGQTLTSGADGKTSTNALGQVHNEVRRDLLVSDAKQLAQTITQQIILPYIQININPTIDPMRIPYFEFDTKEVEDLTKYAEALPKLVGVGVKIPEQWVRDKLGIPDAEEDEAILNAVKTDFKPDLKAEKTALSTHPAGCPCGCQQGIALSAVDNEQQVLDSELDKALANVDFNAQLDPMVKQVVGILQTVESYEAAFEVLAQRYPTLNTQQHQDYLTKAIFLSELLGAHSVGR
ncbi:DUF935 domain-containing protein [Gallibacterium sp. AGMB14963]|uniref:DUF935 domain-containing protein n=1 Tax=Gallibacterium faecale TaxID=3019086 RepID=UPI0022F19082|nr:DUF935 family protein [Gallibacterium sp. AGMB14963]MDA3978478.1 DUF935 family protein [Gallibacterium sp. AGMB14963]